MIAIDRATGRVDRLLDKASREDFCDRSLRSATSDTEGNTGIAFEIGRRYAGLALFDELRQKEDHDLTDPGKMTNLREGSGSLTFEKHYPGAEFVVTGTFRLSSDHLRWDVRIRKTSRPAGPSV